jgi:hypothetical protein
VPLGYDSAGGSVRIPPLVLSRLSRGGKTTVLYLLFEKLKQHGYAPIYITFNGGFQRLVDETDAEAILRLIGVQFINVPQGRQANSLELKFNRDQVLEALTKTANGLPVVLLVDELNSLRKPLDVTGACLLREEFLDKKDRYLVFSTHEPMNVDAVSIDNHIGTVSDPTSQRGFIPLQMPFSTDVRAYHAMFGDASIYPTPVQVAIYGGIPSLLYSSLTASTVNVKPRSRCLSHFSNNEVNPAIRKILCNEFVEEFFTGDRSHANVRRLDIFSSVDNNDKSHWPLCFVAPILEILSAHPIAKHIGKLIEQDLTVFAERTETGLDWEIIVQVAILLRCFGPPGELTLPFFGLVFVLDAGYATIPASVETLEQAYQHITSFMRDVPTGKVVYFTPQFAKFPDYDGILAYKATEEVVRLAGTQVKLSRGTPKHDVPTWMESAFLIRGNAPNSPYGIGKWVYMDKQEMLQLLGNSLAPLYPNSWPEMPDSTEYF